MQPYQSPHDWTFTLVQRVSLKGDDSAPMLLRTPPTTVEDPLRSGSISLGVGNPPAGAKWFRVVQADGPAFSGFPAWIPAYAQSNYSVKWWSEYAVSSFCPLDCYRKPAKPSCCGRIARRGSPRQVGSL